MSDKIILQKTGVFESSSIDSGYLGYTFEIGGEDISQALRDALGIDGKDVTASDIKRGYVLNSTLVIRVTIEMLGGELINA